MLGQHRNVFQSHRDRTENLLHTKHETPSKTNQGLKLFINLFEFWQVFHLKNAHVFTKFPILKSLLI